MQSPQHTTLPSPKSATPPSGDDFSDIAQSSDDFSDIAQPHTASPDSLTPLLANPKKQGTYKMLPTAESPYFKDIPLGQDRSSQMVEIPYGNIQDARKLGFTFATGSGDDTRYAHNLFTELHGQGKAPGVQDAGQDINDKYGVIPTPAPGTAEWFKRGGIKVAHGTIDSLPTAGAIVGGLATGVPGAATGPGDIAIASAGAAAGSAVGEAAKQAVNHVVFGEQQTPKERAKNIGEQALLGGASEGGGRIIAMPIGAAAKYFGMAGDASAQAGIRLLPSEAAGKAPTWPEDFLKGSVLSKGIMDKFRDAQNKESLAAANKLMDNISSFKGTPEQMGLMVQKGLEESEARIRAEQDVLYGALDNITEKVVKPSTTSNVPILKANGKPLLRNGVPVTRKVVSPATTRVMPSMTGLKQFAQEQLDKINKPPYFLPPDAAEKARAAFNTILQNPDNVSFKRMRDMRSVLLTQVRDLDQAMGGSQLGLAKKFSTLADKSLEDAAKNSGIPGLYDRWREANAVTAEGHRMFEQKLVDKAVESENPEFIASLLGGKTIGLQQTRDLFKALPSKLHDPVRRGLLQDAVTKATERSGAFDEGKFANSIYKLGDERGQIIFGKNWKNVKELSELLGKISGPVGLGGGGGASLQNVGIMKKLAGAAISVPITAAAVTAGAGHIESGAIIGLGGVAAQAAGARTVAWAMTNPAKAEKMLKVAREIARKLPYLPPVAYNTVKDMSGEEYNRRFHDYIEKQKQNVLPKSMTPGPQSSVKPPAAQGQVAYNHIAVNPVNGHRIGSSDGITWRDIQTGQQVA